MLSLVVTVPATDVEVAVDALFGLGVLAVEEREGEERDGKGAEIELWTSLGDQLDHLDTATSSFPPAWRWRLVEIDPTVADTWREFATPTWVTDRLLLVPAWKPTPVPDGVTAVTVEPADTFGAGDHPTTVLTARGLLEVLRPGASVLDVGCGSGVLSVVAAVAGAGRVEAVDIHLSAVGVTLANAAANGVAAVVRASLDPLSAFAEPFDVVLANILAPALIELAPDLVRLVALGGVLVISGILAERHEHVLAALAPLVPVAHHQLDGWVAVTLSPG